jgi:hypothetical protein
LNGLFTGTVSDASTAVLSDGTIQSLQYILIALGTFGSIYTAYKIAKSNYGSKEKTKGTTIAFAVLMVLFGIINILLFTLPMSMRM